jgi:excisionase family DNA binding protein
MQAYATAQRIPGNAEATALRRIEPQEVRELPISSGNELLEQVLSRLADLVADKLAARIGSDGSESDDRWLDTREAAQYLGVHRDTVRRLAAERVIPAEQAGTGCKLYFRQRDLYRWRQSANLCLGETSSREGSLR